jgi:eukaryotic-like serine/threonine-protein kinase
MLACLVRTFSESAVMKLTQLGPYQIGKPIGKGGMGFVYEATDSQTGQQVAVKALSPHLAQVEGFRERFEAEIESLKTLRHDGIVRLYGYGEQEGMLFYSMELVRGTSLEDELKAGRRFNWREVTDIAIQLCVALKHAHDHGIIHRDIKPANVLVDLSERVKLADFGIARLFGSTGSLTSAGGVLGTADYMSPEQADGRLVTARCDQYSLGGVMYALLAGRPPFRAKSLPEMLQLQRFAQPEPVSRYASDTPKQLEQVVMQLLSKDPARRFPNMQVLARHLQAMVKALSRPAADGFALADEEVAPPNDPTDLDNSIALAVTQAEPASSAAMGPPVLSEVAAPSGRQEPEPLLKKTDATLPAEVSTGDLPSARPLIAAASRSSAAKTSQYSVAPPPAAVFTSVEEEQARQRQLQTRTWTSALGPLAGLILLAGFLMVGMHYIFRPYTADELYAKISSRIDTHDPDSIRDVGGDIEQFLSSFPADRRVAELQTYQQRIELDKMHRQLQRHRGGIADPDLLPIEVLYLEAIDLADTAPEEAIAQLESLVKLYGSVEIEKTGGESGNASSDEADEASEETDRRAACVRLAERQLKVLRQDVAKLHARQLVATQERLTAAERFAKNEPERAREIYRAIIDIYGERAWAADLVTEAQRRLRELSTANSATAEPEFHAPTR